MDTPPRQKVLSLMGYLAIAEDPLMEKSNAQKIKVAIVDDNRSILTTLQDFMAYAPSILLAFSARSGEEFLEKMKNLPVSALPDVVIMDVNMPGMSGIEAVRHGTALYPGVKFLMLTVFDDDDTLFEAIRAGASGYLLKDEKTSVIISHIESLMAVGSVPMSPRIARKTLDLLASGDKSVPGTQLVELHDLSSREKDVLYLLVDGLEYRQIAEKLNISPHTVRKHISNIYEKLHITSKAQAIRLMQGTKTTPLSSRTDRHRILLVDDHQIILDSLSMMMGSISDMEVVGKISDPRDVRDFLNTHQVDIMITDISMPHLDGLRLSAQIREVYPQIKILLLTVSDTDEQVREAQRLGIEGYILKKANKESLTQAIRKIMKGEKSYSLSVVTDH
jgi:DNA-binding NarL/FixJ family response regulator